MSIQSVKKIQVAVVRHDVSGLWRHDPGEAFPPFCHTKSIPVWRGWDSL